MSKETVHEISWPAKTSNTVIIQSCVPQEGKPYDEALEWLKPIHSAYCKKWKYDYLASSDMVIETEDENFSLSWNRIPLIQKAFELGYEYAIWIDHDCVIVDFNTALVDAFDEPSAEIMMCVHPGFPQHGLTAHFNAGVMMAHNSEKTRQFFDLVWENRYQGPPWFEQDLINKFFEDFEWMSLVGVMSDRYNSTPNANQVPDDQVVIAAFHGIGQYQDVSLRLGYMKQFAELRNVQEQIEEIDNYIDPLLK
jgi:hypothetical protein